jgi:hypothetical protein
VDVKIDDGKPAIGNFRARKNKNAGGFITTCTTTNVSATADYNFAEKGVNCRATFATP